MKQVFFSVAFLCMSVFVCAKTIKKTADKNGRNLLDVGVVVNLEVG